MRIFNSSQRHLGPALDPWVNVSDTECLAAAAATGTQTQSMNQSSPTWHWPRNGQGTANEGLRELQNLSCVQRFLQFRLGSHQLPIVLGRFAGGQHVARANRVCTHCGSVAVADELHMIFECPALQAAVCCFVFHGHEHHEILHSKIICRFSSSFWTVLMLTTFDLCLLLYVIRLAGWLKHCNLSVSLS